MINRRGLITGLISLVAAPAIVRASNIMPIKSLSYQINHSQHFRASNSAYLSNTPPVIDCLPYYLVIFDEVLPVSYFGYEDAQGRWQPMRVR